jgi:hypothetical protein
MMAIRRLYLAKLDKMPSDLPHEERCELARKELDKVLGPIWRDEVEAAGEQLDPTGDMIERLDKLPEATREAGYHGDDVVPPVLNKKEEEKEDKNSILLKLIKFLHG